MGFNINIVLDVLFPPKCPFCNKAYNEPEHQCCELPFYEESGDSYNQNLTAAFFYKEPVVQAIYRYKRSKHPAMSRVLGEYIVQSVRKKYDGIRFNGVVFIPLMNKKLRERGFNNAGLLAKTVAESLNIPLLKDALYCTRESAEQKTLTASARKNNVKNLFATDETFDGMRLLLIDDVCTTGSTLTECTKILMASGAKEVKCAVLASTESLQYWK